MTAKPNPEDLDAVFLVPANFGQLAEAGQPAAIELETMLLTRRPEELFAAEDESDWQEWIDFFSQTRASDGRRKGLVEIVL